MYICMYIYIYIYIYPPLLITDLLICQLSLLFPYVSLHLFVCSFICSSIVLLLLSYPLSQFPLFFLFRLFQMLMDQCYFEKE